MGRYKNIEQFPNVKVFDAGVIEGVDATSLRMALAQKDEDKIAEYLPDDVSVDEFLIAINTKPEEKPEEAPEAPAEQPPAETPPAPPTETTPPEGEQPLQESPPINFDDESPYQDYVEQNRRKIEQAAAVFNLPIPDMEYAFNGGSEVVLNDDMWKEMENTKSYTTKTLSDAIAKALNLSKSDTVTLSDVISKAVGLSYSDTTTLTDAIAKSLNLSEADTVTLSDTITRQFSLLQSDSVTLSDSIVKGSELILSDTVTLSDNASVVMGSGTTYNIDLSDSVTLSDIISISRIVPPSVSGGGYIATSYRKPKKTVKPYEEVVIFDDYDMVAIFEKFLEVDG